MESCVALESPQMERAVIFFALLSAAPVAAQISGQDVRNTSIPDMNTHFQMPAFASRQEWLEKAAFLRKQILSSAGLLPMPEKTPLQSKSKNTPFYRRSIEGRVLMTLVDGKVVFETGAEIGAGTSPRSAR